MFCKYYIDAQCPEEIVAAAYVGAFAADDRYVPSASGSSGILC